MLEQLGESARDEPRRLSALATQLLARVLLKGELKVGQRLVDFLRAHQRTLGECLLKSLNRGTCVVNGVTLALDQLAEISSRIICGRPGAAHGRAGSSSAPTSIEPYRCSSHSSARIPIWISSQ